MSNTVLCPECMNLTEYDIVPRTEVLPVKGEIVTIEAQVAVCRTCGQDIGDETLDDETLRNAYAVYRARHNLLQPEHIRSTRSKYGLGQKAFARLLGFGDVTLARYEAGSLQSSSHDQAMRLAEDPSVVRRLLAQNSSRLTPQQLETLEERLGQLSTEHEGMLACEESTQYGAGPGVRRLREMAVYFAEQNETWRTKLNKLLFYADFLHFKRHGTAISGARYVHMQYGPVPADFYALQATLVDDTSLDERLSAAGDCAGTIFVANRPADRSLFSDEELSTLDYVARTFDGWSATRVSEFSHRESAWMETCDRDTIDYKFAERLQLN